MTIQTDFDKFMRDQQQTEFRPGQRVESEFAEFERRNEARRAENTERFPVGATAFGVGMATLAITKNMSAAQQAAAITISAVSGELLQNIGEDIWDLPTQPTSGGQVAERVGFEMGAALVGEGVGHGAVRLIDRTGVLQFFRSSVTPEAREAMDFFGSRPGTTQPALLPASATENRALDLLHNVSEHSLFGGGRIQALRLAQEVEHEKIADAYLNAIAPHIDADDAGRLFAASARDQFSIQTAPATAIYNTLIREAAPRNVEGQLVGGISGSIEPLKQFVAKDVAVSESLRGIGDDTVGGSILTRIANMSDRMNVGNMIELRRRLRATRETLEASLETKKSPAIGNLKQLERLTNEAVERAFLEAREPDLFNLWRQANALYRNGSKRFNNRIMRRAAQMADFENNAIPEDVVKTAFAPGKATRMLTMKEGVSPVAWQNIARAGMSDILAQSTDPSTGRILGQNLEQALVGRRGLGEKGLVTAVGAIEAQRWLQFAKAVKTRQAKQTATEGGVLIQLTQGGALLQVGGALLAGLGIGTDTTGLTVTGTGVLLAPAAIARIMTNPNAARALIEGVSAEGVNTAARRAGLTTRILQALVPRQTEVAPPNAPDVFPRPEIPVDDSRSNTLRSINQSPAITR